MDNALIETMCNNASASNLTVKEVEGNYTLLPDDSGKYILANSDQVTIPTGLNVGFNTVINQVHATQQVLFVAAPGVTILDPDGKTKTAKQHATVSIICVALNTFKLSGYTA